MQENLCCKINEIGDSIKEHTKGVEIPLKRMYLALEKSRLLIEVEERELHIMEYNN